MITPNKAIIPENWIYWNITTTNSLYGNWQSNIDCSGVSLEEIKQVINRNSNFDQFPFLSFRLADDYCDCHMIGLTTSGHYISDSDLTLTIFCTGIINAGGNMLIKGGYIQFNNSNTLLNIYFNN